VRGACDILAGWDGRADIDSPGEALWEMFFDDSLLIVPFDPAHPLTTPRGIDGNDPAVQRAFADAAQFFQGSDTARGAPRWAGITLHGCPEEKGCFNVIEASGPEIGPPPAQTGPRTGPAPGQTGPPPGPERQRPSGEPPATSIDGSSFIMAVELTRHGPRARTILTHSQSANPA
jgi:acyl-homoserine-lactone acylase